MHRHLTKPAFLPLLIVLITLTSCQKELSFTRETGRADSTGSIDSTQLIRSITGFDQVSGDSLVESYSYDTANRKIIVNWAGLTDPYSQDPIKAELSYNSDGMLTRADYAYPAGYTLKDWDVTSLEIVYDADKILHTITEHAANGSNETILYTKTILSSGNYQLSWDIQDPGSVDWNRRRAVFNNTGINIVNVDDHRFVSNYTSAGDTVFNNVITSDSLFFDGAGSVVKVIRNKVDTLMHTNQSYTFFNFPRLAKGDQMYNHRQKLLRGIAEMPFGDGDPAYILGFCENSLDHEYWQYSKYPLLSADIRWLGTDYHFTGAAQFDSLDRLVKFNMFFLDMGLTEGEVRIRYYK